MTAKKRNGFTIAFIVCIAVLAYLLNESYRIVAFNTTNNVNQSRSGFAVLTFNVDASDSTTFSAVKQNRLLDLVRNESADVLCFQELSFVNLMKIKSQLDSIYGLCEILKGDDQLWRLRLYSGYPLRNFRRYKCEGEIDTTGFNNEEVAFVKSLQRQMNVMSAEFEIEPDRWVTVFSGHLRSSAYSTARRSMDKDASWFEGISLYKRNYDVGKRIRDYEAENVRRFVDEVRAEGKPVIVAGDLNDWCGSDCLNTLMGLSGPGDELKDAWWEGGNGFGWTYFGWHLRIRLDHILYSDELELVDVKVIDTDLSDHKPLMARFRLK